VLFSGDFQKASNMPFGKTDRYRIALAIGESEAQGANF
jgi:hypothetical protein